MPPWLLALITPVLGFGGALLGTKLNQRGQRRTRLEDTYGELFGSVQLMLRLSFDSLAHRRHPQEDEAWVRFGTALARVLLLEHDEARRVVVAQLEAAVNELYTIKVYLDREPSDEEKFEDGEEHLHKMQVVRDRVDLLLAMLRGDRIETTPRAQVDGAAPKPTLPAPDGETPAQLPPVKAPEGQET